MTREWKLAGHVVPADTVRQYVFRRDGNCMGAIYEGVHATPIDQRHPCNWRQHPTIEHVTMVHTYLESRKDDERHTVALCGNLNGDSMRLAPAVMKRWFRAHLVALYPGCSS